MVQQLLEQIRAEVAEEVKGTRGCGKTHPWTGDRTGGRKSGFARVCAIKAQSLPGSRHSILWTRTSGHRQPGRGGRAGQRLNADPEVNGILVQLPLPAGLDEEKVLERDQHRKRCGWFPPDQYRPAGAKGRDPLFVPCTPAGVMYLLEQDLPNLEGVNAVVLGARISLACRWRCCWCAPMPP